MPPIRCRLLAHSVCGHVQQIYTGLFLLHRRGLIDLTQEVVTHRELPRRERAWWRANAHLRVVVNERLLLHYDLFDGAHVAVEQLRDADFYFKRSFARRQTETLGEHRHKLQPLGLNYLVYPDTSDPFAVHRQALLHAGRLKWLELARSTRLSDGAAFTPRVRRLESLPDLDAPPRILFMVRAWDPQSAGDRPRAADCMRVNETRADCIRALREHFGPRFHGGFTPSEYATRTYPDLLVPDPAEARPRAYLDLVRAHPICVATTGLHGSIGWKFAEYVALARAIVSEPLNYEVPGDLRKGTHYLEFHTPDECVDAAERLATDRKLRARLMTNNALYYQAHVRPDALVMGSILRALALRDGYAEQDMMVGAHQASG